MSPVDPQGVTWVRVEKPVFDLWGVITSSLTFAVGCVIVAALLGGLVGWLRIRRIRDRPAEGPLLAGLGRPSLPTAPP